MHGRNLSKVYFCDFLKPVMWKAAHISGMRTVFGLGIVTVQKVVPVKIHLSHIMDLHAG